MFAMPGQPDKKKKKKKKTLLTDILLS